MKERNIRPFKIKLLKRKKQKKQKSVVTSIRNKKITHTKLYQHKIWTLLLYSLVPHLNYNLCSSSRWK